MDVATHETQIIYLNGWMDEYRYRYTYNGWLGKKQPSLLSVVDILKRAKKHWPWGLKARFFL